MILSLKARTMSGVGIVTAKITECTTGEKKTDSFPDENSCSHPSLWWREMNKEALKCSTMWSTHVRPSIRTQKQSGQGCMTDIVYRCLDSWNCFDSRTFSFCKFSRGFSILPGQSIQNSWIFCIEMNTGPLTTSRAKSPKAQLNICGTFGGASAIQLKNMLIKMPPNLPPFCGLNCK